MNGEEIEYIEVKTKTKVYIIPIKTTQKAIEIAEKFRKAGINTDLDLAARDLRKNLDYANKMEIPFVVFVGEKELSQGKIKLRNMQNGSEDLLKVDEAIETLKRH
jgi:histidyl-tRNA synthetase